MAELEDFSHSMRRSVSGYDRLAWCYRWIEWLAFGGALMRARKSLVFDLAAANKILVLGDGDGRLLTEIAKCQPAAQFISVEQSPKMLNLQRRRIKSIDAANRVNFICSDATLPDHFQDKFDTIVAGFFLDCFDADTLDRLLPTILNSISEKGEFYVVDFIEPAAKLPRIYAKSMLFLMHRFFAWQTGLKNRTLVDVPEKLGNLGWEIKQQQDRQFKMITARIYVRRKTKTDGIKTTTNENWR